MDYIGSFDSGDTDSIGKCTAANGNLGSSLLGAGISSADGIGRACIPDSLGYFAGCAGETTVVGVYLLEWKRRRVCCSSCVVDNGMDCSEGRGSKSGKSLSNDAIWHYRSGRNNSAVWNYDYEPKQRCVYEQSDQLYAACLCTDSFENGTQIQKRMRTAFDSWSSDTGICSSVGESGPKGRVLYAE